MADSELQELAELSTTYELSDFKAEDVSESLLEVTKALYDGDRRLDTRLDMNGFEVRIKTAESNSDDRWQKGIPINFSRGGALLDSPDDFHAGEKVWMLIDTNRGITGIEPILVGAEVRHSAQHGSHYRIGVQFKPAMIKDMRRHQVERSICHLEGFLQAMDVEEH